MKDVYVLYGKCRLTAEIPDENLLAVLSSQHIDVGDKRNGYKGAASPTLNQ